MPHCGITTSGKQDCKPIGQDYGQHCDMEREDETPTLQTTTTTTTTTISNKDNHSQTEDVIEWRRGGGGGGGSQGAGEGEEEGERRREEEPTVTVEHEEAGLRLQRSVTLLGAISFTIGTMLGSGIFITPTTVLRSTKSVALSVIVWCLGGVVSLFGSFTMAELACRVPKHGEVYTYLKAGFGSWLAFIYAWTAILILTPSNLAITCLTFSRYFMTVVHVCGTPQLPVTLLAVTLIVTLCLVNITSNVLSVRANVVFLFTKVLALIVIIIGGLVVLIKGENKDSELASGFSGTTDSPASIAKSFSFVMWAYGGWSNANFIVEEVKNPSRNVPLAAIVGVLVVTVIYVLTNVSYLAVMSPEQMLSADTVAVTWGNAVLGMGLASFIIPFCVMMSTAGSANSSVFAVSRLIFAAARDGNFPEVFSYLHVHSRIPLLSVTLEISLGIVFASSSDLLELIKVSMSTRWFFFFLTSVSLLILRYRQPKDMDVPFKQPLPGVIFFMLFSLYVVVVPLIEGVDFSFYFSISCYFVAFLIFCVSKFLKNRTRCDGLVTFLQLFLNIGPPAAYSGNN